MGPRLFSRGNLEIHAKAESDKLASMGPRLFSRGNAARGLSLVDSRCSFNGAATLQSRKYGKSVPNPTRKGTCFNGAATLQSRKLACRRGRQRRGAGQFNGAATLRSAEIRTSRLEARNRIPASMGPRLFVRGNQNSLDVNGGMALGFDRGRDSSSRKYITPHTVMIDAWAGSMGPRLFSRGNWDFSGGQEFRPKLLQWGREASVAEIRMRWQSRQIARASMGPRLFSRGNDLDQLRLSEQHYELQWGRDSSVAEIGFACDLG